MSSSSVLVCMSFLLSCSVLFVYSVPMCFWWNKIHFFSNSGPTTPFSSEQMRTHSEPTNTFLFIGMYIQKFRYSATASELYCKWNQGDGASHKTTADCDSIGEYLSLFTLRHASSSLPTLMNLLFVGESDFVFVRFCKRY